MYGSYTYQAVRSCLYAIVGIMVCLMLYVIKLKILVMLSGIRWGDLQQKSRSFEYFLVVSLVAVPVVLALAVFNVHRTADMF